MVGRKAWATAHGTSRMPVKRAVYPEISVMAQRSAQGMHAEPIWAGHSRLIPCPIRPDRSLCVRSPTSGHLIHKEVEVAAFVRLQDMIDV